MHLHVETQKEHPRSSHGVRCCNLTYSWREHAQFNRHEQGASLRITCKKCGTVHFKWTARDWSPIE